MSVQNALGGPIPYTLAMQQQSGIRVENVLQILGRTSYTLEFWYTPTGANGYAYMNPDADFNTVRFSAHLPYGGTLYFDTGNSSAPTGRLQFGMPAGFVGSPHHIAFVVDFERSKRTVYIDGGERYSVAGCEPYIVQDPYPLDFPANQGTVGEVRYWNYARSLEQINELKDFSISDKTPGLQMCLRMDERGPSGTKIIDRSGYARHGRIL
ncbi:LamG-like jellyroll fold domain-containing protein [Hymenobacter sp. YC55]|uniref:LamG-like jellyroll fold domain-containing protein n=1 Tax=Hymenobacter sp. YC55 TaxID=3034019 RepID=UPI0023F8D9A7|nr:LamG-like jellyroll fold domain-containing protein [Hymenobacter sp. YC55]MDF7813598.1 hypothetical protein [Hymenobacter sp. YC55]